MVNANFASMQTIGKLFIMASLFYLAAGTTMGFIMAFLRGKWTLRLMPAHAHINLFGWVSMLIFGFVYSYLPAFAGKTLYSTILSYIHFVFGNIGLIGMACSGLEADSPIPRFYLSLSGLSGLS